MLPGIILPLVWSVNGPLMSRVFIQFLEDLLGPVNITPKDAGTLIHYRFYINVGALSRLFADFGLPEDSLELLAGMEKGASMPRMPRPTPRALRRLPHILSALARFRRYDRTLDRQLPGAWESSRRFAREVDLTTLDAPALLRRMEALEPLVEASTYYHTVTLMIMRMYTMRLRSRLQRAGMLGPDEPLDLRADGNSVHDLGHALDKLAVLARALPTEEQARLRAREIGMLRTAAEPAAADDGEARASDFVDGFNDFMRRFGHLADSGVNMASPSWSEQPEVVLAMIAARLDSPAAHAGAVLEPRQRRLRRAWQRAIRYHTLRDETSSLYTYTYGQYRPIFLTLADRLIETGALETREDVFYLTLDELRRVVDARLTPAEALVIVRGRRAEVEIASKGEPPEVVVGDTADLIELPRRRTLRGIASSRGRYTGRVVVCRGLDDIERVEQGAVVVVPFSDASWNALFTRAGAVVAESGGMLSHSAILAREYGVPAVVSVRGALSLDDGALVTVDGLHGTVSVLEDASWFAETRSLDADPA
jgi:pyruvate,water dikinase